MASPPAVPLAAVEATGALAPVAPSRGSGDGLLERSGSLEVRLARSQAEVEACQRLRYQVFVEEMAAKASEAAAAARLEADRFDEIADHLLVIDSSAGKEPMVIGTYRFLRDDVARAHGGFYTGQEYDIEPVLARAPAGTRFVELGRSCVHRDFRTRPTINMLWRGIGHYVARHHIDVMFGCASFPGTNPDTWALPLSFLHKHFLLPEEWRVQALPDRFVEMARIPSDEIDEQEGLRALPPLIRGYVRAGCLFGNGAVVDHEFGTVDVLVMLFLKNVRDKYFARFGAAAES